MCWVGWRLWSLGAARSDASQSAANSIRRFDALTTQPFPCTRPWPDHLHLEWAWPWPAEMKSILWNECFIFTFYISCKKKKTNTYWTLLTTVIMTHYNLRSYKEKGRKREERRKGEGLKIWSSPFPKKFSRASVHHPWWFRFMLPIYSAQVKKK